MRPLGSVPLLGGECALGRTRLPVRRWLPLGALAGVSALFLIHAFAFRSRDEALYVACVVDSPFRVRMLSLGRGVDTELRPVGLTLTPLSVASGAGSERVVRMLLAQGADVDGGPSETPPLHSAASDGHGEVARILLEHGADPNAPDPRGSLPIHEVALSGLYVGDHGLSCSAGAVEVLDALVAYGADVNARTGGRMHVTALHLAAGQGREAIVARLLELGADIQAADAKGWTPLHSAACHGEGGVVEQLLAAGADREAVDNEGRLPADEARMNGHPEVAALLGTPAPEPQPSEPPRGE